MQMVDEADWTEYIKNLFARLLSGLPETEAEETREAFEDIHGWLHSANLAIGDITIELVKSARTPTERARIDQLLKARRWIDLAEAHLEPIVFCRRIGNPISLPVANEEARK